MPSPFDIMAETYDADFTYTTIGALQRQQVWNHLQDILKKGAPEMNILEINCGTGEDAIKLARLGHTVTATDSSELMIEIAATKARSKNIQNVQFKVCAFDQLEHNLVGNKFDLVISNFGGLNCIDSTELRWLSKNLSKLLNTEGKLLFVIMSSCCIWEIIYYSLKGKLGLAFRRRKNSVVFRAGNEQMSIFYYSPRKMIQLFQEDYKLNGVHPVGLFVPPSYLEKNFAHRPRLLHRLARIDNQCMTYSFLSNLADHFCIILQKKGTV